MSTHWSVRFQVKFPDHLDLGTVASCVPPQSHTFASFPSCNFLLICQFLVSLSTLLSPSSSSQLFHMVVNLPAVFHSCLFLLWTVSTVLQDVISTPSAHTFFHAHCQSAFVVQVVVVTDTHFTSCLVQDEALCIVHCPKVFTPSRAMSYTTPFMSRTPSPGTCTPSFPTTRPTSTSCDLLPGEIEPLRRPTTCEYWLSGRTHNLYKL